MRDTNYLRIIKTIEIENHVEIWYKMIQNCQMTDLGLGMDRFLYSICNDLPSTIRK